MFKKILAALTLVLISVSAFAQSETCTYHPGGGKTCWGSGTTGPLNQGRVTNLAVSQPTLVYDTIPAGVTRGTDSQCAGLATEIGATIGAELSNDNRGTQRGRLVGYLLGNHVFCKTPPPQQVVIQPPAPAQQTPSRLEVYAPKGAQGDSGFMCFIEGEPEAFPVKDRSTCSRLAGRIAQAKAGNASSDQHANNRADPPKPWGHQGTAGMCYLTQELKGEKPAKCLQVSVVAANNGESMSSWKARLP